MPTALGVLSTCVRNGCESPELLAVQFLVPGYSSRQGYTAIYDGIVPMLEAGTLNEGFDQTLRRVRDAMAD